MVEAEEEYLEQLEVIYIFALLLDSATIIRIDVRVKIRFRMCDRLFSSAGPRLVLPSAVQDGSVVQATATQSRGRQLDLPQLRDCALPPPNLLERPDIASRVVADSCAW